MAPFSVLSALWLLLSLVSARDSRHDDKDDRDDNSTERERRQGMGYRELLCGAPSPFDSYSYNPAATDGPQNWWRTWGCCGGQLQSPIALDRRFARCMTVFTPYYNFSPVLSAKVYNSGHDVKASVTQSGGSAKLRGVGRTDAGSVFTLDNVHFHFGNLFRRGSEHLVDGETFEGEIHFVHYNDKYRNVEEAMLYRDGLAVIGVLLSTARGDRNTHLDDLLLAISALSGVGVGNSIPFQLMPERLLPMRRDHFHYHGSLTTPSCSESAQFMIMVQPLLISTVTLQMLWNLPSDVPGVPISVYTNVRPLQPANGRTVSTNFIC